VSQLSVQLIAAQFKVVGIMPVCILLLVLSIDLTVGFLAPNQSVIPTFDLIGTLVTNYSGIVATTSSVQTATNVLCQFGFLYILVSHIPCI
jgi:hypothetical protein